MTERFFEFLKEQDVKFNRKCKLSKYSTIGIGGYATVVTPTSIDKFVSVMNFLDSIDLDYKVVGRTSNILFPDSDVESIILKTTNLNTFSVSDGILFCECGASFSSIITKLASLGYGGFEELYCIPGTVGGMIFQNAGAYSSTISDHLIDVDVYCQGEVFSLTKEELSFSYRSSSLSKSEAILLSARFNVLRDVSDNIFAKLAEIKEKRNKNQPFDKRSLGSIFKRIEGIPVSMLIDKAGLKGKRIGGAKISDKHAGFIINDGTATAKDVKTLIGLIKSTLFYRYGIIPELEIEIFE